MKKVKIFTNHFYPETFRINALAQEFSEKMEVEVITQVPNYPKGDFFAGYSNKDKREEVVGNVKVKRLWTIPRKQSSKMLVLNYLSYTISTYLYGAFSRDKVDHVFTYVTSPIFLSWGALKFAKRNKALSTLYLLDLWPDSLTIALNIQNKSINKFLNKITLKIYKRFDQIAVSSSGIKQALIYRGIDESKIKVVYQHADELFENPLQIDKNLDKVKIVFTGNHGTSQGLETLVECSKILDEEGFSKFHFMLVGAGRNKENLINLTKKNNVEKYFTFIDQVPIEEVKNYLSQNHFGFVSLKNESPLNKVVPAKVQSYMAIGLPIISSGSGDIIDIVKEANCGYTCDSNDPQQLANLIKEISHIDYLTISELGKNGFEFCNSNFDLKKLSNELMKMMKEVK